MHLYSNRQCDKLAAACVDNDIDSLKSVLDNVDEETVGILMSRSLGGCKSVGFSGTLLQLAISMDNVDAIEYLIPLEGHNLENERWDTGLLFSRHIYLNTNIMY